MNRREALRTLTAFTLMGIVGCTRDAAQKQVARSPSQREQVSKILSIEDLREHLKLTRERYELQCQMSELQLQLYDSDIEEGIAPRGDIHDLDTNVVEILQHLPNVTAVEVGNKGAKSVHRFIHIRDAHFLPKEIFLEGNTVIPTLSEEQQKEYGDLLYEEFLWETRSVQEEEKTLLRCLIRHHGLTGAHAEGYTDRDMEVYLRNLEDMRKNVAALPEFRRKLKEVEELIEEGSKANRTHLESYRRVLLARDVLRQSIEEIEQGLVSIGALGQLAISGELKNIFPLDSAEWHDRATEEMRKNPSAFTPSASPYLKEREDAMVRKLKREKGTKLIVLGGVHNLADNAHDVEVISVSTKAYGRRASRFFSNE